MEGASQEKGSAVKIADRIKSDPCSFAAAVMIIIQILLVFYYFEFEKYGYHSDEMWSYGYANAADSPNLFGENVSRFEVWTDGSVLKDYLVANKGEQFRYDLVWRNMSIDFHPPLYFAVLHTICSFFPDVFSKQFAFFINIVSAAVMQVFLYKGASRICRSEYLGLAVLALWGFSCGFVNMTSFLRNYAFMAMFAVMLVYCHSRIYYCEGSCRNNLIMLGIVTFLGGMVHYYFLATAFIMAAFFCFYFLFGKKIKMMFAYGAVMAGSAGLVIAAFPASIRQMLTCHNPARLSTGMPVINGFKACFFIVFQSLTGIYTGPYLSPVYSYVLTALVFILIPALGAAFLFRKEEWFRNFLKNAKKGISDFIKKADYLYLCLVTALVFTLYVVADTVNINSMVFFTDRYLFHIMPITAIVLVATVKYIICLIKPLEKYHKAVISLLCCAAVIYCGYEGEKRYLYPENKPVKGYIASLSAENTEFVVLIDDYWRIVCYPEKLMDSSRVFFTTYVTYPFGGDTIADSSNGRERYVLIETAKTNYYRNIRKNKTFEALNGFEFDVQDTEYDKDIYPTESEIVENFEENIYKGQKLQYMGREYVSGQYVHVYKAVPEDVYVDVPLPEE